MVRNDEFFLKLWVDYYARFVPRQNLYILVDGDDSALPDTLQGCQVITFPQNQPSRGWDRKRWNFLSQFASSLTYRFDVVIGGDVDELIVLDPLVGNDPVQYILQQTNAQVISPFAIEVVQRVDLEPALDAQRPILEQRRYGRTNAFYCKPCITRAPISWSLGQHYSNHPRLNLSSDLFLFHLRFFDRDTLLERQKQRYLHITNDNSDIVQGVAGAGWAQSVEQVSAELQSFADYGPPETNDFSFEHLRKQIKKKWRFEEKRQIWKHAKFSGQSTFVIPERFSSVF
ncbi:glycosyltransferase family 2 protein [Ruegeria sp. R8_1]